MTHAEDSPPKQWYPVTLSYWANAILLFVELGFIATIIALDRISFTQNGIVDVPEKHMSGLIGSYVNKNYSLLWTSLPSFLFSLYALIWAAVVSESAGRQPYIELQRGAGARKTVMLDYNALPAWKNWYVALRNKHGHIAAGLILAFSMSTIFSSLAAHLLVARPARFSRSALVTLTTQFDTSAIDSKTNLQPFIDIATAVQAYNSSPPTWMTDTYAFERFSASVNIDSGNLTANTSAYSALLQCKTIDPGYYQASLSGSNPQTLHVNFTDGGCLVKQDFSLSANTPIYAKAWYNFCSDGNINRFGMFAGTYSGTAENHLRDFSVTCCVPTYWQTDGSLTMGYDKSSGVSSMVSFVGQNQTQIFPGLEILFEQALRGYTIFNPAAATNADAVGYSIYSAAQQQQQYGQTSPNASAVLQSTQKVYATVFAALTNTVLLQPRTPASSTTATLSTAANRLFISGTVAWVMVGAMIVVVICHINLVVYAKRHDTMLDEDPVGLLGAAKVLRRSDLFEVIDHFEEIHPEISRMQKYMKKHYRLGRGDRCWWDETDRRITAEGMMET